MNYFALGFGAAALVAVGAIDYANQASAAGKSPGSFSPSAYFATYGARITTMRGAGAEPISEHDEPIPQAVANTEGRIAESAAAPAVQPEPEPKPKPSRLELSGGISCLDGSAGRFCRE